MNKETAGQKEMVRQFFRVEDMFDFDNLGFTNTVGKYKVGIAFNDYVLLFNRYFSVSLVCGL